jgi:predicted signal transduction protein with EAL and GGDEF domain
VVKEFVIYTLARLGLFVASYAIVVGVYLLVSGAGSIPLFWPFLVAIVISSFASVYLLKAQRARFAAVVERRATAATRRFEESRAKEDEADS